MGTTVIYNGVTLKNVLTLHFEETPRRDPSGTDRWFNDTEIRIETVVNKELLAKGIGNAILGTFANQPSGSLGNTASLDGYLLAVISQLGKDRGDFSYTIGGTQTTIQWLVSQLGPDFDNGPKVTHCRYVNISPTTVVIQFGIKLSLPCCDVPSKSIINHRWCVLDDLDENYRTVRMWRGLIRLAPAGPKNTINAHELRNFSFPPLADGFKRKRMHFANDPIGLQLLYEVVDEEMIGQAPPWPATRFLVVHSETVELDATLCLGDIYIRLEGPKGAEKGIMIETAMQIIEQKFLLLDNKSPSKNKNNQSTNPNDSTTQLTRLQIIDYGGDSINAIEVHSQVKHFNSSQLKSVGDKDSQSDQALGAMMLQQLGQPIDLPDYNDQQALLLGPYGTADFTTLFACFLQEPCNQQPATYDKAPSPDLQKVPNGKTTDSKSKNKTDVQQFQSTGEMDVADWGSIKYSDDASKGIYTFSQIDIIVSKTPMRLGLPIALSQKDEDAGKDTTSIVRLGGTQSELTVRISMERTNLWPQLLRDADFMDSNKIQYSLTGPAVVNSRTPTLTSDASKKSYAIDAQYHYAMSRPLKKTETFPAASLPWDSTKSKDNKMPKEAFLDPDDKSGKGIN